MFVYQTSPASYPLTFTLILQLTLSAAVGAHRFFSSCCYHCHCCYCSLSSSPAHRHFDALFRPPPSPPANHHRPSTAADCNIAHNRRSDTEKIIYHLILHLCLRLFTCFSLLQLASQIASFLQFSPVNLSSHHVFSPRPPLLPKFPRFLPVCFQAQ